MYHRVVLELRVNVKLQTKEREKGGVQWIFPPEGLAINAILVFPNDPPGKGDERLDDWDSRMECVPAGKESPQPPPAEDQRILDEEAENDCRLLYSGTRQGQRSYPACKEEEEAEEGRPALVAATAAGHSKESGGGRKGRKE